MLFYEEPSEFELAMNYINESWYNNNCLIQEIIQSPKAVMEASGNNPISKVIHAIIARIQAIIETVRKLYQRIKYVPADANKRMKINPGALKEVTIYGCKIDIPGVPFSGINNNIEKWFDIVGVRDALNNKPENGYDKYGFLPDDLAWALQKYDDKSLTAYDTLKLVLNFDKLPAKFKSCIESERKDEDFEYQVGEAYGIYSDKNDTYKITIADCPKRIKELYVLYGNIHKSMEKTVSGLESIVKKLTKDYNKISNDPIPDIKTISSTLGAFTGILNNGVRYANIVYKVAMKAVSRDISHCDLAIKLANRNEAVQQDPHEYGNAYVV